MTKHTVSSYGQELDHLSSMVAEMGGCVESMLTSVVHALKEPNPEEIKAIIESDHKVNQLDFQINVEAIRVIALRQPMAFDLRLVISALKISADLERMGDNLKTIAKRLLQMKIVLADTDTVIILERMGRVIEEMLRNMLDIWASRDIEKIVSVCQRDKEVNALHNSIFRELLTWMVENPRFITTSTHYLFITRSFERIGDHIKNIAEQTYYMITGELLDDDKWEEKVIKKNNYSERGFRSS